MIAPLNQYVRLSLAIIASGTAMASASAAESCAWGMKHASADGRNLLFLDSNATYWTTAVSLAAGEAIEIKGTFPDARYMSLVIYDVRGRTIDHLTDRDIVPDPGSVNPFTSRPVPSSAELRYSVAVVQNKRPIDEGNRLLAFAAKNPQPIGTVRITYRIYLPDEASELADDRLPDIMIIGPDGARKALPRCKAIAGIPGGERLEPMLAAGLSRRFSGMERGEWRAFYPDGLGENVDNAYIYSAFDARHGPAVLIAGRAPLSSTAGSRSESGREQLRYWSFCSARMSTAVIGCLADENVPRTPDGRYLLLLTAVDGFSETDLTDCGVARLPVARGEPTAVVYRHMLPSSNFREAIQNIPRGGSVAKLGEYLPEMRYFSSTGELTDWLKSHCRVAGES